LLIVIPSIRGMCQLHYISTSHTSHTLPIHFNRQTHWLRSLSSKLINKP